MLFLLPGENKYSHCCRYRAMGPGLLFLWAHAPRAPQTRMVSRTGKSSAVLNSVPSLPAALAHSCSSVSKIGKSWNSKSAPHTVEMGAVLGDRHEAAPRKTWA